MEPTTLDSPLSVRQLITPSDQAAKDHLDKHLDAAVKFKVGVPREKVIEAILGLLDFPLTDILFPAWEQFKQVRDAMAATRGQPGSVQRVSVAGHTFTSEHHPTLEGDLDDVKVLDLKLDLELSLHFAGVVVKVAGGEIMSLALGDTTVTASLKTDEGVTLIPEQQMIVVFSQPLTKTPVAAPPPPPERPLPVSPAETV